MRPDKIIFMQTFPTGEYRNQKLGMEILLDDGDSPKAAFQLAKELVNEAFRELNPQLDFGLTDAATVSWEIKPTPNPPPIRNTSVEKGIMNATTVGELNELYDAAEKYGLTIQWDKKLNELNSAQF